MFDIGAKISSVVSSAASTLHLNGSGKSDPAAAKKAADEARKKALQQQLDSARRALAAEQAKPAPDAKQVTMKQAEVTRLEGQLGLPATSFSSGQPASLAAYSAAPPNANDTSLLTEKLGDGRANCLEKAEQWLDKTTPQFRQGANAIFLKDQRGGAEGADGHVVIEKNGKITDPTTGKAYDNMSAYLNSPENVTNGQPNYAPLPGNKGSVSAEKLSQILNTEPNTQARADALKGIDPDLQKMWVADPKHDPTTDDPNAKPTDDTIRANTQSMDGKFAPTQDESNTWSKWANDMHDASYAGVGKGILTLGNTVNENKINDLMGNIHTARDLALARHYMAASLGSDHVSGHDTLDDMLDDTMHDDGRFNDIKGNIVKLDSQAATFARDQGLRAEGKDVKVDPKVEDARRKISEDFTLYPPTADEQSRMNSAAKDFWDAYAWGGAGFDPDEGKMITALNKCQNPREYKMFQEAYTQLAKHDHVSGHDTVDDALGDCMGGADAVQVDDFKNRMKAGGNITDEERALAATPVPVANTTSTEGGDKPGGDDPKLGPASDANTKKDATKGYYYTVKDGDTLWDIGKSAGYKGDPLQVALALSYFNKDTNNDKPNLIHGNGKETFFMPSQKQMDDLLDKAKFSVGKGMNAELKIEKKGDKDLPARDVWHASKDGTGSTPTASDTSTKDPASTSDNTKDDP